MKLTGADAARFLRDPDPGLSGALLYGQDSMRVALKRKDVVAKLVGPQGEDEMRLERVSPGDLRKDPALLTDALKAQGFFPGQRLVLVDEATDGLTDAITSALSMWQTGDAFLLVTAGGLAARSKLRKAFETARTVAAIGIYNDPPSRAEIETELSRAGVRAIAPDALRDLTDLAQDLDPGDLRQTIEKVALYVLDQNDPVSPDDIAACAPVTIEAALDDIIHIVAETRTNEIGPMMQRLAGQGVTPVGLVIGATRHFRTLYVAASDPGGPGAGIQKMRPPVFGPRRDRMVRQATQWGAQALESALTVLMDTDLQLRSAGQRAPQMALVERALIRLSILGQRRRS